MGLAQTILHDRKERRKVMAWILSCVLLLTIAGAWPLGQWLGERPLVFIFWWLMVALVTLMLLLMAVYDALAAIGEERRK